MNNVNPFTPYYTLKTNLRFFTYINSFENKIRRGVDIVMGRKKLGNANAQRNNNVKKGNKTSSELVEFTTGNVNPQKNRK